MQQIHHCSAPPRLTRTPRRHNRLDDQDFLCLSFELTKAHVAGVSRASKAFDMSVQKNVALGQSTPPNYMVLYQRSFPTSLSLLRSCWRSQDDAV